jgi:glucosamine-6-phosphate deaminase
MSKMKDFYTVDLHDADKFPVPVEIVETDIDLYYHIAISLYREIEENNARGRPTTVIVPVGPVFQYRRFAWMIGERPLDLSGLTCFFMDEYLNDEGGLIAESSSLSFRGFIRRELLEALPKKALLDPSRVIFPDPAKLEAYDGRYAELGGADTCYAGIGITGHLAFNEPPPRGQAMSAEEFKALPSRVVELAPESVAINSNTALRGAMDRVPKRAVTIGFKQILMAKRLRVYCNRPWQSAVIRRALFEPASPAFPVTLARDHRDLRFTITEEVAQKPDFRLR